MANPVSDGAKGIYNAIITNVNKVSKQTRKVHDVVGKTIESMESTGEEIVIKVDSTKMKSSFHPQPPEEFLPNILAGLTDEAEEVPLFAIDIQKEIDNLDSKFQVMM